MSISPDSHAPEREMLLEIDYNNGIPTDEEFFVKDFAGMHNDDIARILFSNWDFQKAAKFVDDKEAMFRRIVPEQLKPIDGIHKLCKWVKDHGLKCAAVTNAPRANTELMISMLSLSDFFQVVIIGSECDRAKSFPDPYLKALKEFNALADHTFIFEDSASGIKAGAAAGMPVIGLTTRNPKKSLKEAGATFLIRTMKIQSFGRHWKSWKEWGKPEMPIICFQIIQRKEKKDIQH